LPSSAKSWVIPSLVPRSVFTFPHSHLNTPDDVRFLDSEDANYKYPIITRPAHSPRRTVDITRNRNYS